MNPELKELQENKDVMMSEVEAFAKSEYEVARLKLVDSAARLIGSLLLTICLILVAFAVLAFCAAAAVFALSLCLPTWAACLIIGGVYLLLIPLLIACSKALFINPIVSKLTGLKSAEELKYEMLRAEGRAAVHRERMSSHVRFVQTLYRYYSRMAQTAWQAIRRLFGK